MDAGDLTDLGNLIRALGAAGIDGRGVAEEVAAALNGTELAATDRLLRGDDEREWRPIPLAATFLAVLEAAGPLSPHQAEATADIVLWYGTFWAQHRELCSSPVRVSLLLDSIRDYAEGRRSAVFRPYYKAMPIEPAVFGQWADELDRGGFFPAAQESASWRGPITSIRALKYTLLNAGHAVTRTAAADYHACGSASYFLLGDADFEGFDASSCWICPGTRERACGELCVDVRD
jgi:hypothetical protein